MSDVMILSLPSWAALRAGGAVWPAPAPAWVLVRGGAVAARGRGDGWREFADDNAARRVVALAPAVDAPVRFLRFADLPPMQAATAGRLEAQRQILGAAAEAHVVAAVPMERGGEFAVASVSQGAMAAWRDWLAAQDLLNDRLAAVVPVAAVLPAGDAALQGVHWGAEAVMRGGDHGYAGDAAIDALFGAEARWLSEAEWDALLVQAAAKPVMDLRHGAWKMAAASAWTATMRRWAVGLGLALVGVSLALIAVEAGRLALDAKRADAAVMALGAELQIQASDAAGVEAAMDQRLRARGGGPLAFSVTASALMAAVADRPAVSLRRLAYGADGMLTASLQVSSAAEGAAVVQALRAKGYAVSEQIEAGDDGRISLHIFLRAL